MNRFVSMAYFNRPEVMRHIPLDADAIAGLPAHNDGPIWVAWWQGLNDRTPAVIRACIDSITRHAGGREVIIVTRENYAQYASIDPILVQRRESRDLRNVHVGVVEELVEEEVLRHRRYLCEHRDETVIDVLHERIANHRCQAVCGPMAFRDAQYASIDPILVQRRETGTLTINAFCNALRVKLLYEHGGVWLDSTLYLTEAAVESICSESSKRPLLLTGIASIIAVTCGMCM